MLHHIQTVRKAWDYTVCSGIDAGARLADELEGLHYLLFGEPNPRQVHLKWRFARHMKATAMNGLIDFKPALGAGRTPKNYPEVGVLLFDVATFQQLREEHGGSQGLAYVRSPGTDGLIVGTTHDGSDFFGLDRDVSETYTLAMGIGRGILRCAAGLSLPDGTFLPVPVYATERVPRDETHATVPMV